MGKAKIHKTVKRMNSFIDGSAFCPGPPNRVPSDSEKHLRVYTSSCTMSRPRVACWYGSLTNSPKTECVLTPSLWRPQIFFRPPVGQRVNAHSVFWEFCRKSCQHATRGCDKRWMTCIHAGVSRSPREHASVPPDKRHCRQWMSSLFCGFLPNPFTCSVEVPGTNL